MNLEEEYQLTKKKILTCILEPGTTGYVVSSKFLKDFQESINLKLLPDRIDNKDLYLPRSKKLKPNLVLNKDYYVVNSDVWNSLCSDYGSAPPLTCKILQNGQGELYPVHFTIQYQKQIKDFLASRGLELDEFHVRVMVQFEINTNDPFEIYFRGSSDPIPLRGFIGDLPLNTTMLDVIPLEEINSKKKTNDNEIKQTKESSSLTKLPPGIKNIGNSCYLSASFQCFRAFPALQKSNLVTSEVHFNHPSPLTRSFLPLIRPSNRRVLDPSELKSCTTFFRYKSTRCSRIYCISS